jgi:RNA polymerase sigma factor (TIGR02999 family)
MSCRWKSPTYEHDYADMNDVTQILSQIEQGDPSAVEQLLPLVYDELRKLAAAKLAQEKPGQTLQATALVHDAYIRLVDGNKSAHWDSRRHFFAAAAEAMRRILVESARRRRSIKRGGGMERQEFEASALPNPEPDVDLCELDAALALLKETDPQAAELVNLRYFAGLTSKQAAELLQVSPRTADRIWEYARAWLLKKLRGD